MELPQYALDLLKKPIACGLATAMPNGQPQVTPVWFDYDGEHIRINTARGRQKDRNMTRDAKVTLFFIDPNNMNHWAEIRGRVADITEEGANAHINALSHRYDGKDFTFRPDQTRVIYKIVPEKVNGE
jgi:PPOX class probable F420-dependent enzyme